MIEVSMIIFNQRREAELLYLYLATLKYGLQRQTSKFAARLEPHKYEIDASGP